MTEPQVTLDPHGESPVEQKLHDALEDQLTSALRAATDRVAAHYSGEPVDIVCAKLLHETRAGLHPDIAAAFQPDRAELLRVAEAIAAGQHR
ncbi:hypothetical protein [Spirilliplanes yamanashiensis]|uniref:Uncharacterized protein n=1 Tax=Spirilliplanes yamanashiensis TaxID=42233 RepID=A0A8J4DJE8_9ACTN|nr:hypothetical protein [Spirilliplanes yamanashiensis]MDP9817184.1 hypothetical protein [Spirilliplanes yamanashiensis]GIJ03163.1 hypothetical protein Sya03_25150 [Spirilliplanes yamanashiensis]